MENGTHRDDSKENHATEINSDSENADFWVPPAGDPWDNDNGNDRWEDSANPGNEGDECVLPAGAEEHETDLMELDDHPSRTKGTSAAVGPSSFASRKKKNKGKSIR